MRLNLYRGRYLIAVYDKDDRCVCVASNLKELERMGNPCTLYSHLSRQCYSSTPYSINARKKYYLIDCLEKHNDIFVEEDKLFLEEIEKIETIADIAKRLGVSERTIFRRKAKQRQKAMGREL